MAIKPKDMAKMIDHTFLKPTGRVEDIKKLCEEEDINEDILKKLISLESQYIGLDYRYNVYKKIEKILQQDWIHYDEIKTIDNGRDL